MYAHLPTMYNFVDNHDVTRIASQLRDKQHLYPLYALMFSFPGLPSVYYGSEFGFEGIKQSDDWNLRPAFDLAALQDQEHGFDLRGWIGKLAAIRRNSPALLYGELPDAACCSETVCVLRICAEKRALVIANSSREAVELTLKLPEMAGWHLKDALADNEIFVVEDGVLSVQLNGNQVRILLN